MPSARNPTLETALVADWRNEQAWMIYADWLEAQGDPLGEYLSLRLQLAHGIGERDDIERALAAMHRDQVLGPALCVRLDSTPSRLRVRLRDAFVSAARLDRCWDPQEWLAALDALLSSPSARFTRELELHIEDVESPEWLAALFTRLLAVGVQPALGTLALHAARHGGAASMGVMARYLGELISLLPGLERLELHGAVNGLPERFDHDRLKELLLLGVDTTQVVPGLRSCGLPRLNLLVLNPGWAEHNASCLFEIVGGEARLPKLEELVINGWPGTADRLERLVDSPVFEQLGKLTGLVLDDSGARFILAHEHRFAHLHRVLVVRSRSLSRDNINALRAALRYRLAVADLTR